MKRIPLEDIIPLRMPKPYRFDFIEREMQNALGFRFPNSDDFIVVASEKGMLPNIVIELHCPKTLFANGPDVVAEHLRTISCGYIWHDTYDYWSNLLCMLTKSRGVLTSILYRGTSTTSSFVDQRLQIQPICELDTALAKVSVSGIAPELGGISADEIDQVISNKALLGGFVDRHLIACAPIFNVSPSHVAVGVIAVAPSYRGVGAGVRFMASLLNYLVKQGKTVLGGAGAKNLFAHRTMHKLGMEPISQGTVTGISRSLPQISPIIRDQSN